MKSTLRTYIFYIPSVFYIILCISLSLTSLPASALSYNASCTKDGSKYYCDSGALFSWHATDAGGTIIKPFDYKPPYTLKTVICPIPNDLTIETCYQIPMGTVDLSTETISWSTLQPRIQGSVNTGALPKTRGGPTYSFCVLAYISGADGRGVPMNRADSFIPVDGGFRQYCSAETTGPGGSTSPPTPTNSCSVITKNMEVSYSSVDRASIPTDESNSVTLPLQINCTGSSSHSLNLRIISSPPSWSANAIVTSFPSLAVTPIVGGTPIANSNGATSSIVGNNTINVSFSLSRDPSVPTSEIPTGAFSASATLVVTID